MNKFISGSLMALGVLFIIVLLIGLGFYVSMSMKSEAVPFSTSVPKQTQTQNSDTNDTASTPSPAVNTPFVLSAAQRQALSTFGIDPNTVPSSITPAQEACFTAKLGSERVSEIKSGATPSAMDFFKVKACL